MCEVCGVCVCWGKVSARSYLASSQLALARLETVIVPAFPFWFAVIQLATD